MQEYCRDKILKGRHVFAYFFTFIFLAQLAYSSPPFITESSADIIANTLIISVPKQEIYQRAQPLDFHIHVFNSSGVLVNAASLNCTLHLYNRTNGHLLIANLSPSNNGYNFLVNNSVMNFTGILGYDVWCIQNNVLGGFFSSEFEITESGEQETRNVNEKQLLFYFALAFAVVLLILGFMSKDINIITLAGFLLSILGFFILRYGFGNETNLVSKSIGTIMLGFGFLLMIAPRLDEIKEFFNSL